MSRGNSVKRHDATEVIVAEGILLFDQVLKRQVGAGAALLIHPENIDRYVRNGWAVIPEADDEIELDAEPEPKPARRSRKNVG